MFEVTSNIFNEVKDINSQFEAAADTLRNNPRDTGLMSNFSDNYGELACKIIIQNNSDDSGFCKTYSRALSNNYDNVPDALEQTLGVDPIDYLFGNGTRVLFVSSKSLLKPALADYFHYLAPDLSFQNAGKKFISDYFDSTWLVNKPDGPGFYLTIPTGMFWPDSFFVGVEGSQMGTGNPTRKFLDYLNYQPDVEARSLERKF